MFTRLLISCICLILSTNVSAQKLNQAKPWLGVAIEENPKGVMVKQAIDDTPAKEAGIQAGDIIIQVEKTSVKTPQELIKAVQMTGVGKDVVIEFLRGDKKETRTLQLVNRPDDLALVRQKLLNKPAPLFDLPVVVGKDSGKLADQKGKVVIIEFWATWCPACRDTHARLSQLATKNKNITIYAISDEDQATITPYVNQAKPTFTILSDTKSTTQGSWAVSAIPMIGVIDKEGIVRHITIGGGRYLEEAIAAAEKLAGS